MARMKWERAALLVLMLGSCGKQVHWSKYSADDAYDLADAAQANARTALSRIEALRSDSYPSDLSEEVRRLRGTVDDLERRLGTAERSIDNIITTYNANIRSGQ